MKNIALLLSAFVVTVSLLSFAGDDPVQAIAYTSTQTCSSALRPKTKYAVQCTTDCYVRMQTATTADAGMSVNTSSVLVAAGKLYDTPSTSLQVYLCVVQSAASGTANIFINRGPNE
jgi:hypothetical protein